MKSFDHKGDNSTQEFVPVIQRLEVPKEEIDLHEVVAELRDAKWIVAIVTLVFLVVGVLYSFLRTPVYRADALIQIEQQQMPNPLTGSGSTGAALLSSLFPEAANTDAEIQIMQSRSVLLPVIRSRHLDIDVDPPLIPVLGKLFGSSYQSMLRISVLQVPNGWYDKTMKLRVTGPAAYALYSPAGRQVLRGRAGVPVEALSGKLKVLVSRLTAPAGRKFTVVKLTEPEALSDLRDRINVQEVVKDTGIVKISVDDVRPEDAKDLANAISRQYVRENTAVMALQAERSLNFIDNKLPNIRSKLDSAQAQLADFQSSHGAVALDEQAKALLSQLATDKTEGTQLELVREAQRQRYTSRFPDVIALRSQELALKKEIAKLEESVRQLPQEERGYLALSENVKVYQTLYANVLAQAQDLEIAEAGTAGSARIVDPPIEPVKPVRPNKPLVIVVGFSLGFLFALFAIFVRRALHRHVEDPSQLEESFGLPVNAVIPHSELQESVVSGRSQRRKRGSPLLCVESRSDITVEALRSLKTSIIFALPKAQRKILTFSGVSPSAGKTFVSANIAHLLGESGYRVLLIDADMRRGHLHRYCGITTGVGLPEILSGRVEFGDAVRPSVYCESVHVIGGSKFPLNPLELLLSPSLERLLEEATKSYQFVVIDVPPILAVADALPVARLATMNYLVIRAGSSTLHEIGFALGKFAKNNVRVDGFVFNDVSRRATTYAAGKYGHVYQYSYGEPREGP